MDGRSEGWVARRRAVHRAVSAAEDLFKALWARFNTWPKVVKVPLLVLLGPPGVLVALLVVLTPISVVAAVCSAMNARWGLWAAVPTGLAGLALFGWLAQLVHEADDLAQLEHFGSQR